jgi:hypothetical protein
MGREKIWGRGEATMTVIEQFYTLPSHNKSEEQAHTGVDLYDVHGGGGCGETREKEEEAATLVVGQSCTLPIITSGVDSATRPLGKRKDMIHAQAGADLYNVHSGGGRAKIREREEDDMFDVVLTCPYPSCD